MPSFFKRITNLQAEGPIIDVILFPPAVTINSFREQGKEIPQLRVTALIDTGASCTCIDLTLPPQLNLISRDYINVRTPSGISEHFTYDIGFMLPQQLGHKMSFIEVTGADLKEQGFEVLIGRDILSTCTLIYNGSDNSFQLHV